MTLETGTLATATDATRAAVAFLDDEARWELLQKWLEEESADHRNAGTRSARLEALRSIVSPYLRDREWNEILQKNWPVRWGDQLRLANALAGMRPGAAVSEAS